MHSLFTTEDYVFSFKSIQLYSLFVIIKTLKSQVNIQQLTLITEPKYW
jgi:hypothetical protein